MSRIIESALFIALMATAIFILYVVGMTLHYKISRTPYDWKPLVLCGLNYSVSFALLLAVYIIASMLVDIAQANMPVPVLVGIAYPFWFIVFYAIRRFKWHDPNSRALKLASFFVFILVILHLIQLYIDHNLSIHNVLGSFPALISGMSFGFPFFSWGQQPQE